MRLPWRPFPRPDETLIGFLFRLAAQRGESPWPLAQRIAGRRLDKLQVESVCLGPLAQATGLGEEVLERMTYRPLGAGRRFADIEIPRWMVSAGQRWCCPICLDEAAHHRAGWDLSLVTCCPAHGIRLVGRCHGCGRSHRWGNTRLARCVCGADLRRHRPLPAGPEEIEAARSVVAALSGSPANVGADPLPGLPPGALLDLVFHLGWYASGGVRRPRPIGLKASGGMPGTILAAGWDCVRGWPDGFLALLDRLRAHAGTRTGRYGPATAFGPLAGWMRDLPPGPISEILAEALARYGFANRVSTRSTSHVLKAVRSDSILTLTEAARRLGRSKTLAAEVLARHGILAGKPGRGMPAVIPAEAVADVRSRLSDLLDEPGVARMLGCPPAAARAFLVAAGLKPADGPEADLFGREGWRASDIHAAHKALPMLDSEVHGDTIPFAQALTMARSRGIPSRTVIAALLEGRLPATSRRDSGEGLAGIFVSPDDIRLLLSPADDTVSVTEAARDLGVKDEVAYRWVRLGLLGSSRVVGHRGKRISAANLIAFRTEYVFGAQLDGSAKASRGWAAEYLLRAGVKPISGRTVDGSSTYLFRRVDAVSAGLLDGRRLEALG